MLSLMFAQIDVRLYTNKQTQIMKITQWKTSHITDVDDHNDDDDYDERQRRGSNISGSDNNIFVTKLNIIYNV